MNAIDSNVLLRYLLHDDPGQSRKARRAIAREPVLVVDVVLAETLWVLSGGRYRATKEDLIKVINALFEDRQIRFERPQVVWQAFWDYQSSDADFQDALIMRKAHQEIADRGDDDGFSFLIFDRQAQSLQFAVAP